MATHASVEESEGRDTLFLANCYMILVSSMAGPEALRKKWRASWLSGSTIGSADLNELEVD